MTARRILHALAALAVFAVASIVWTPAASAAPGGMCSVEEWRNPTNFADCARRTQQSANATSGCVTAPTPGSPLSGMPGYFSSQPESSKRSGVSGQYSAYGVGGYGLDTYDIGCLGSVKHPDLVMWNTVASAEFGMAASILSAANGLRERAYDPGSMWGWADGFVKTATDAIYRYVFTTFGALTLAIVGCFLLWRARRGDMSQAVQMTAWALFVMVAVTGIAKWPVESANGADTAASTGLEVVHSVLGPGPQNIPTDKCVVGPEACQDNRTVATRSSDTVVEAVLYRNWLRAMLGSADSETAKKYGPALFDATSMTWGEAQRAEQTPQLRKQLIEQKAATFNAVAEQVRNDDPMAYEHLQGVHGMDRAGAGTVAVISAGVFAAFDGAASIVILFGFGIFRIAVILIPLLGTIAVFMPASSGLRRVFNMTGTAVFNIVVFGAGAGLYLTATDLVFRSDLPGAAQIVVVFLAGIIAFLVLHPLRQFVSTATGRSRSEDGLMTRLTRAGREVHAARKQERADAAEAQATATGPTRSAGPRPETSSAPRRSATRTFAAAAAPSVAAAANHPAVSAAAAATQRPENVTGKPPSRSQQAVAVARAVAPTLVGAAATAAGGPAAGAATSAVTNRPAPAAQARPENRS